MANWAASDLFGAITRVGRWMRSITWAIVKVFPVPVAPSNVTCGSPAWTAAVSWSIASGWSPAGSKSETTRNGGMHQV